jgi:hypothetical protein
MKAALRNVKVMLCASACLGAAVVAAPPAARAQDRPNLNPGNWEISMQMDMEGMPSRPPMTMTHCIKPDQVKDSQTFAQDMQKRNGKCAVSDLKADGGKLSYSFDCEGGAKGDVEMAFAGGTYEGTIKLTTGGGRGQGPMHVIQHIKARRVGDC